jgi:hypothetical protein
MANLAAFGLTFTRNDMINAVLRVLGVIGQTQDPTPEDYSFCSQALNLMIKAWINKGATLWKINELVVPMINGINQYPIGPTAGYLATAGVTITDGGTGGTDGTYALTITDAGGGTGATGTYTITDNTISSVTITAAGSAYVTPVLSFPLGGITGTDITILPIGLTTTRPLRMLNHNNFLRNNTTLNDITVLQIAQSDYNMLGNKATPGSPPCQFFYNPLLGNGQLFVYTNPLLVSNSLYSMHLFAQVMLNDTTDASSLFDFPQEFLNAVKWGLAYELLTEYGVDDQTERRIEKRYAQYVEEAFDFSVEEADSRFTFNTMGRGS